MPTNYALVVLFMLASFVLTGLAIWKWGPGVHSQTVRCPEKNRRARILAEQVEGDFCCLRVVGVQRCSLLPGEILKCDQLCLGRH